MRISRIYTDQPLTENVEITLDAARSHYISRVLRLQTGAQVVLFNSDGKEYPAQLLTADRKACVLLPAAAHTPATESALHTVLGLGISRGERMDYAIQKSTELGVSVICPLYSEFCEVKLNAERELKRLDHWRQIAISACEQSGRVRIPDIRPPQPLPQWLSERNELKLMFDHQQTHSLPQQRPEQGVALLIGPEGGLSEAEKQKAVDAGFAGIALGSRVLRTETAPVAALSVLQYLWS